MEELHNHLQQLPGFLQAELAAHVGDWNGIRYIDITDKHIHAINHLVASKRTPLRQDHIDNSYFLWGTDPWDKSSLELNAQMRTMPGRIPTDFYYRTSDARFHIESIRFLNELKGNLELLHTRLIEQEREYNERMAKEAAQRQAEEAARARAEAEDAARRLAEEQAAQQQAIEAALQLAKRQVEEAEHALALRNAEEARATEAESRHAVEVTFGHEASRDIDDAIKALKDTIAAAITDFSNAISVHGALDMRQLEAIQATSATH
ncbi:hypothetical protein [Pseudomonas syringae group genomosp. 3]|nr:hypothetical protein [Pseudomonas syringae group genomosp. 3]